MSADLALLWPPQSLPAVAGVEALTAWLPHGDIAPWLQISRMRMIGDRTPPLQLRVFENCIDLFA